MRCSLAISFSKIVSKKLHSQRNKTTKKRRSKPAGRDLV
jgi:hypothetical protein